MNNKEKRKQFTRFEFRLIIIFVSILGFLQGATVTFNMSFDKGFYVSENIVGESMHRTLTEDSKILYISHDIKKIKRGDIVRANAYKSGFEIERVLGEPLIIVKRVIALPNETITIKGENIYINDVLLDEPYAYYDSDSEDELAVTLKDDQYFLMGDNRNHSADSREFDISTGRSILGVALIIK